MKEAQPYSPSFSGPVFPMMPRKLHRWNQGSGGPATQVSYIGKSFPLTSHPKAYARQLWVLMPKYRYTPTVHYVDSCSQKSLHGVTSGQYHPSGHPWEASRATGIYHWDSVSPPNSSHSGMTGDD
jgi:hypothetical protein